MNIWTGDGFKDVPADRMGPRMRYKESIEELEEYIPGIVEASAYYYIDYESEL